MEYYKHVRRFIKIIIIVLLLFNEFKSGEPLKFLLTPKITPEIDFYKVDLETKKELVYREIQKHGIQNPEIVLAQTLLESANYTSKVFLRNNNMFGMKFAKQRKTTAISDHLGYAKYSTWQKSIEDYALYQSRLLKGKKLTNREYLRKLHLRYAEDPNYIVLVNRIASTIPSEKLVKP